MRLFSVLTAVAVACAIIISIGREAVAQGTEDYGVKLWSSDVASLHGVDRVFFCSSGQWSESPCVDDTTLAEILDESARSLSSSGIKVERFGDGLTGDKLLELLYYCMDDGRGGYVLNCWLHFNQAVVLTSGRSMSATTWSEHYCAFGARSDLPGGLRDAAEYCIGEFVKDYLIANKEGYMRARDSIFTEMEAKYGR